MGKERQDFGESKFKLLTAKAFYSTINKLSDVEIPKNTGDFRLVDRKVVEVYLVGLDLSNMHMNMREKKGLQGKANIL